MNFLDSAPPPLPKPAPGEESSEDSGVGVLGYLGFILVNIAAWGIIGISSSSAWLFGLIVCIIYTVILGCMALRLEGAPKYAQFVNLFWVMCCTFVGVTGANLSFNAWPETAIDTHMPPNIPPGPPPLYDENIESLISGTEDTHSAALFDWARRDLAHPESHQPHFANFEGSVFFAARASNSSHGHEDVLWRSDGQTAPREVIPQLTGSCLHAHAQPARLFFLGRRPAGDRDDLWVITPGDLDHAAKLSSTNAGSVAKDLFIDEVSANIFFKLSYYCRGGDFIRSIAQSDGTPEGTQDLRAGLCAELDNRRGMPETDVDQRTPKGLFLRVLFLSILPMVAIAGYTMVKRRIGGVFFNLYLGSIAAVILVVLLVFVPDDASEPPSWVPNFVTWFLTFYSLALYMGIVVFSIMYAQPPNWMEELKTWAVFLVGCTFFSMAHWHLSIPFGGERYQDINWMVYTLYIVVQMGVSIVISRNFPMILSAIGLMMISVKASWELVELFGLQGNGATLAMLSLLALAGMGIIGAAIFYTRKKDDIDQWVQSLLIKLNSDFRTLSA